MRLRVHLAHGIAGLLEVYDYILEDEELNELLCFSSYYIS